MNNAIYEKSASQILVDSPMASSAAPATLQKLSRTVAIYTR
jgi:hypothetical protein